VKRLVLFIYCTFITIFNLPNYSIAISGTLIDCDKSPTFTKRLNTSLKKLQGRISKYDLGTPGALAIQDQITQTENRFARYANSSLMCGADGLPHLITDGDWSHASEFIFPALIFLYFSGWIGWSGRKYLQTVALMKNSYEKEIIIDVPLALSIMFSGYLWPFLSWAEFSSGNFVSQD